MKYRITTYYTRRGIWLCYFTRKLYLHSPSARENTTQLVKELVIFHSYSCNKLYLYIYYINTMAECRSGRKCIAVK